MLTKGKIAFSTRKQPVVPGAAAQDQGGAGTNAESTGWVSSGSGQWFGEICAQESGGCFITHSGLFPALLFPGTQRLG